MADRILTFKDTLRLTEISVSFIEETDESSAEVMIDVDTTTPWFAFDNPDELKQFITELHVLHQKLKEAQKE